MSKAPASAAFLIRDYRPDDAAALMAVFRAAVRIGARKDYTEAQVKAWAPDVMDFARWSDRLEGRVTWVAEIDGAPVGFTDLEPDGHLDMLYVHPDHHRRGVARALLAQAAAEAQKLGVTRLYTEASLTARRPFQKCGYRVIAPQTVVFNGQSFVNFRMEKVLD